MRFHISAAVLVTAFSFVYRLTAVEYGLLFFAIGLVIAAECLNTAVEAVVDLASPERRPLAKRAKDAAAGGVLIAAVASAAIGFCLFFHFPQLTDALALICTSWRLAVFAVLLVAGTWFTFLMKNEEEE